MYRGNPNPPWAYACAGHSHPQSRAPPGILYWHARACTPAQCGRACARMRSVPAAFPLGKAAVPVLLRWLAAGPWPAPPGARPQSTAKPHSNCVSGHSAVSTYSSLQQPVIEVCGSKKPYCESISQTSALPISIHPVPVAVSQRSPHRCSCRCHRTCIYMQPDRSRPRHGHGGR